MNGYTRKGKMSGLHVAFLFAAPLILKDRTNLKSNFIPMNIDKVGLRKAWINYYIKEYQ